MSYAIKIMHKENFTVATPADFEPVIVAVLNQAKETTEQASVVTLIGDLGAGKTTCTQQLAQHLGISDPVVSPTFGIMKVYELDGNEYFGTLVHIDAYRIEDISEAGPLRLEELFVQPRTLVCLEWPEKIAQILPDKKIEVAIEIGKGEERIVTVV